MCPTFDLQHVNALELSMLEALKYLIKVSAGESCYVFLYFSLYFYLDMYSTLSVISSSFTHIHLHLLVELSILNYSSTLLMATPVTLPFFLHVHCLHMYAHAQDLFSNYQDIVIHYLHHHFLLHNILASVEVSLRNITYLNLIIEFIVHITMQGSMRNIIFT